MFKSVVVEFCIMFFFFVGFSEVSFSLIITEVVYNYPYETDYCQYIEIFNDGDDVVDLSNLKISVSSYFISITNIFLKDFECGGITNSFLLYPGQFAVILPYVYAYSSKPFYFPSNTLVLTTSTRYLAGSNPIKKDFISSIKLLSNDVVLDYVSEDGYSGLSIERTNGGFTSKDYPTLGYWGNSSLFFSKQLYSLNEQAEINLIIYTNLSSIQVEVVGRGLLTLTKVSENAFRGKVNFYYNGEKIIAKFGNMVATCVGVNLFEFSDVRGTLVVNEICFSPTKRWFDFFYYGYSDGVPREIDKYFEVINLGSNVISLTNLYLHCIGDEEVILNVGENAFYSSQRGILGDKVIGSREYILVSSPGISSNMVFMLKDAHPYRGGKLIDFIEEQTVSYIPFSHSNKFSYVGKSTVSLLPNGLIPSLGGRFLNWSETPSRYNGFSIPYLVLDSKYKKVNDRLRIILIDSTSSDILLVKFRSGNVSRNLILTNLGFYYFGEFLVSTNYLDPLYVEENSQVVLEYYKDGSFYTNTFFVIGETAFNLSSFSDPFLEKSIIMQGETINLLNVSSGDSITFFDSDGTLIKHVYASSDGVFIVDSKFLIRRGIYFIEIRGKKGNSVLRLFVF